MKRRLLPLTVALGAAIALVLAAATGAVGSARGLIFDDGAYYEPGSLDDGKDLLPQTTISLAEADATAQRVATGELGQVDLEHFGDRIVFAVDVGPQEVRVDADSGVVVDVRPRD
ncbi:MAG TPA: hypothetical protein VHQ96_01420 [Gaiellaceae bacterium]|jgi:uncharacterized membrane protein YkoI|nr:hypothetical protein [Gaiellaceae bacterium]